LYNVHTTPHGTKQKTAEKELKGKPLIVRNIKRSYTLGEGSVLWKHNRAISAQTILCILGVISPSCSLYESRVHIQLLFTGNYKARCAVNNTPNR